MGEYHALQKNHRGKHGKRGKFVEVGREKNKKEHTLNIPNASESEVSQTPILI